MPQKLQVESGADGISDAELLAIIRNVDDGPESESQEINGAVH